MKLLTSPLTGTNNLTLIRKIDIVQLIAHYKDIFGIDISNLLRGNKALFLYQCNDSGFRFYYPFDIVGNSAFYHKLESNKWYYMPTKWEFEEAIKHIPEKASILEIGSARGDFLNLVRQTMPKVKCAGLELNKEAANVACSRGFDVVIESSWAHANERSDQYDVIASFQVLEHIPNPLDLLKDALVMLKVGGKLIIGVPDNSSRAADSIFVKPDNILNMPPHHQGLWDIPSLTYLQKVMPLNLEYIAIEPATASHHSNSYRGLMKQDLMRRFGPFGGFAVYAMGRPFYNHALQQLNRYLPAHSVLAVFKKTST